MPFQPKLAFFCSALAVVVLTISGCGGDATTTTTSASPKTTTMPTPTPPAPPSPTPPSPTPKGSWRENFEAPNPARFAPQKGLKHCEPWPHCMEAVDSMMKYNADLGGGKKGLRVTTSSDPCTGCSKPGDVCYDSVNKTCAPFASQYLKAADATGKNVAYTFGDYEVSMRTGHLPDGTAAVGMLSCFTPGSTVEHNDFDPLHNEIALCFDGTNATQAKFFYWYNQTIHTTIFDLGFDSSAALHTYKVTWRSDTITWYVDGKLALKTTGIAKKTIPWEPMVMVVGVLKPHPYGPNSPKSSSVEFEYVSYSPAEDLLGESSAVGTIV